MGKYSILLLGAILFVSNCLIAQKNFGEEVILYESKITKTKNVALPDYSKYTNKVLRRKLRWQKFTKGFGVFNVVWGGLWFVGGTAAAVQASENRVLGIVPAVIGAGAGFDKLLLLILSILICIGEIFTIR
ncbi:MAG: hypothetical protein ACK5NK_01115 [Niabella sp.]